MSARPEQFRSESKVDSLRVPPQSVEAEQAVLGCLLVKNDAFLLIADWLSADDFYRRDHRMIYRAFADLLGPERKGNADVVTLGEWFEANGLAEQIGGASYLVDLGQTTASAANIVAHAEIVREKSLLRQLIDVGTEVTGAAFDPKGQSAGDVCAQAQSKLLQFAPSKLVTGLQPAKALLKPWFEDLTRRAEPGAIPGLPTPWADLNRITQGLQDGEVYVVAGRSNMGKSVMGFQLASFTALRGDRVALFSMEQTATAVINRCVSALAEVQHRWLREPRLEDDGHWARVSQAARDLNAAPLLIDDTPRLTAMQIRARAARENLRQRLRLIVVDHLHEITLPGKQGEVIERADALRVLKALAKELNCPVVVLAQLNRAAVESDRPDLKHLRGSGGIEEVADVVIFVHRPDYYQPADRPGLVELIIGKGRDIPTGETINLRNRYDIMRADDWEGSAPQRPQQAGRTWSKGGQDRAAGGT